MSGVFNFYRNKSFPSNFIKKGYLEVSNSTGNTDFSSFLGTGNDYRTDLFATRPIYGSWIKIKMKYPVYITHYSVYQCKYPHNNLFRNWELDGSNDEINWFALDNYSIQANTTMQKNEVPYLFTVQKPSKYKSIKLIMYRTARTADNNKYHLVFSGFEIFGILNYLNYLTARKSAHGLFLFIYNFVCSM